MLKLTWFCDNCKKEIVIETLEVSDAYEIYHPGGVNGCSENEVWRELCDDCYKKWLDKINVENPNSVWAA